MSNYDAVIPTGKFIARVDEQRCIGCALCTKACPFDAIIGASKQIHTVITQYCTGCKLCLPPCPVDCIELQANTHFEKTCHNISLDEQRALKKEFAAFSRNNRKQHVHRLERIKKEKQELFERRKGEILNR